MVYNTCPSGHVSYIWPLGCINEMKRITLIIVSSISTSFSFSQTGNIHGLVYENDTTDITAYANVSSNGNKLESYSDSGGRFNFDSIPSGEYTLRVSSLGYRDTVLASVFLKPDSTLKLKIKLTPFCCQTFGGCNICPICNKSDSLIEVSHDKPTKKLLRKAEKGKVILAKKSTNCVSTWYCTRDKTEF